MEQMRPAPPDPEIFAAALRGDDAAWSVLHRQWAPSVLGWCRALGGGRVDPDEAARDVFFRLWRTASRIRGPGVFGAFLYSITRRVISEHRRRAWGRRWIGAPAQEPNDRARSPAQQTAAREIAAAVQGILDGMKAKEREVLVLCDIQGHTAQEAGELIGISPNTVKSRLLRARKHFRDAAERKKLSPQEIFHA